MEDLREKIEARAYDIYEARTYWDIPGDTLSDWLEAEKEILHAQEFHKSYDIAHQVFTR